MARQRRSCATVRRTSTPARALVKAIYLTNRTLRRRKTLVLQRPDTPDEPPPRAISPRHLRREVLVTFAASVVLTGGLSLVQQIFPSAGGVLYLAVALVFIGLPTLVVRAWRRADPIDAGMRYGSLTTGLFWGLGATLLTLIPFAIGFHIWTAEFQGYRFAPAWGNYLRWAPETEGRPAALDAHRPGVYVWTEREVLRVWWIDPPTNQRIERADVNDALTVEAIALDGHIDTVTCGPGVEVRRSEAESISLHSIVRRGPTGCDLVVSVNAEGAQLGVQRLAKHLSPDHVHVGGDTPSELPLHLYRDLWWLLNMMLTQFIFVGLPEEYFYRGYVQPTLDRATPGTWGFGRARLSRSIVLGSVLFALGHVLIDWQPLRLTVFFPSLAFGWLRQRSDGLLAPIIYHAFSNILVEVAVVHYFR